MHSPFVYNLVTKCFYNKPFIEVDKHISGTIYPAVLKKKHFVIINYFVAFLDMSSMNYFCGSDYWFLHLPHTKKLKKESTEAADLIFYSSLYFSDFHMSGVLSHLKNNSCLLIEYPYKNTQKWKELKNSADKFVIIDTYFFGFIFKRPQQKPEGFFIRM